MDITNVFNDFREAARHLWNTYFKDKVSHDQAWDLHDCFSEVYIALFKAFVCCNLNGNPPIIPHLWDPQNSIINEYKVIPRTCKIPLMINRDIPPSGYWDYPTKYLPPNSDLRLISLFDFDQLGFKEFEYYRVRILASDNKEIINRDALIKVSYCKIMYKKP